jgi:hypothetical protein
MASNEEDIFDTTGLREGVRQCVELMELQNLQQIINVVLVELVDCGQAKLVESAALELEDTITNKQ